MPEHDLSALKRCHLLRLADQSKASRPSALTHGQKQYIILALAKVCIVQVLTDKADAVTNQLATSICANNQQRAQVIHCEILFKVWLEHHQRLVGRQLISMLDQKLGGLIKELLSRQNMEVNAVTRMGYSLGHYRAPVVLGSIGLLHGSIQRR